MKLVTPKVVMNRFIVKETLRRKHKYRVIKNNIVAIQ